MENEIKGNGNVWQEYEKNHKRGKVLGGLFVVIIGSLFLARELGAEIPQWIFTWKMLLIGIGAVVIVKHNFQSTKGLLLMLVGAAFLISDLYPSLLLKPLLWPIMVIVLGLFIIFKPRRKHRPFRSRRYYRNHRNWTEAQGEEAISDDRIEVTTVMGSSKRTVLSKNFKGGFIKNSLGGTEVNLSQADFEGTVILEIYNELGGIELTVPANWVIQSELVCIMGSVEDERPIQTNLAPDTNKTLILRGNVYMGGVEIRSY